MTDDPRPSQRYTLLNDKYKQVSHIVWHAATGHWPEFPEIVHHIDEDPFNNELSNLQLMTDSKHKILHQSGKHHTDESKAKISATMMGKFMGSTSSNWIGNAAKPQSKYKREWRAKRRLGL